MEPKPLNPLAEVGKIVLCFVLIVCMGAVYQTVVASGNFHFERASIFCAALAALFVQLVILAIDRTFKR